MGCALSKDQQKAAYDRLSQYQLGKINLQCKTRHQNYTGGNEFATS